MRKRGKVVQFILDKFEDDPRGAWSVSELAQGHYSVSTAAVTKAHRVAVLRAMARVCELEPRYKTLRRETLTKVIYDGTDLFSTCMGVIKGTHNYRDDRSDKTKMKDFGKDRKPGGRIYRDVELHKARISGDDARVEELDAEIKAEREAQMKAANTAFRKAINPPPPFEEMKNAAGLAAMKLFNEYPDECAEAGDIVFTTETDLTFKIARITEAE